MRKTGLFFVACGVLFTHPLDFAPLDGRSLASPEPSGANANEVLDGPLHSWPVLDRDAKTTIDPELFAIPVSQTHSMSFSRESLEPLELEDVIGPALSVAVNEPEAHTPSAAFMSSPDSDYIVPQTTFIAPDVAERHIENPQAERRVARARIAVEAGGDAKASHHCLAQAIYFEARGETEEGQAAVAQVVLNRVHSEYYPKTVCDVVYQNQTMRNRCQFSFACDGREEKIENPSAWRIAQRVARNVGEGRVWIADVGHSTHYHATSVRPNWISEMVKTDRIGRHVFYRVRRWETPDADLIAENRGS